jgi:hypothetical protein
MKYYVSMDSRGYVTSITHTGRIDYVELNLDDYDLSNGRIRAYKLGKNKLIFDEVEWKRIQEENQHKADEKEIADLEQKLADTDYIFAKYCEELLSLDNPITWVSDVIKLNLKYMKQYSEVIKNRKKWRERIEELRGNNS